MLFRLFPILFCLVFITKIQAQKIDFIDFELNDISVRAIQVINDSTVYFAGSNGKYGRIINDEIQLDSISYKGKMLNFRSIASNGTSLFLLSIENPAILYQVNVNPLTKTFDQRKIVYQENHNKVFYDALKFYDNKNGIAMGDPTEGCLSIILTQDGGESWHKIACNKLPNMFEGEAAFAASNTNIAIKGDMAWLVSGGKKARVFIGKDYGQNWEVIDTPIIQGGKMTGIFTVDFYDQNNGIIMGGNWEDKSNTVATKAITKNGGKTWELIADGELPGYISCVQYVPNTNGKKIMAVSTEGIFLSQNKGKKWKKLSDKEYYLIQFIDKDSAWLSGNNILSKINITH